MSYRMRLQSIQCIGVSFVFNTGSGIVTSLVRVEVLSATLQSRSVDGIVFSFIPQQSSSIEYFVLIRYVDSDFGRRHFVGAGSPLPMKIGVAGGNV